MTANSKKRRITVRRFFAVSTFGALLVGCLIFLCLRAGWLGSSHTAGQSNGKSEQASPADESVGGRSSAALPSNSNGIAVALPDQSSPRTNIRAPLSTEAAAGPPAKSAIAKESQLSGSFGFESPSKAPTKRQLSKLSPTGAESKTSDPQVWQLTLYGRIGDPEQRYCNYTIEAQGQTVQGHFHWESLSPGPKLLVASQSLSHGQHNFLTLELELTSGEHRELKSLAPEPSTRTLRFTFQDPSEMYRGGPPFYEVIEVPSDHLQAYSPEQVFSSLQRQELLARVQLSVTLPSSVQRHELTVVGCLLEPMNISGLSSLELTARCKISPTWPLQANTQLGEYGEGIIGRFGPRIPATQSVPLILNVYHEPPAQRVHFAFAPAQQSSIPRNYRLQLLPQRTSNAEFQGKPSFQTPRSSRPPLNAHLRYTSTHSNAEVEVRPGSYLACLMLDPETTGGTNQIDDFYALQEIEITPTTERIELQALQGRSVRVQVTPWGLSSNSSLAIRMELPLVSRDNPLSVNWSLKPDRKGRLQLQGLPFESSLHFYEQLHSVQDSESWELSYK